MAQVMFSKYKCEVHIGQREVKIINTMDGWALLGQGWVEDSGIVE